MMKSKKQKITKLNLDEELLREAAEIEEEIKNVPLEENPVDKERLRSAILMQVLQEERKKQQKRSARRRIAQGAAVFAVTMTGIFGLSMTSQANRIFLVEKVEEFFSGSTTVNVDSSEEAILPDITEQQARDDIEQTLEVDVPEFFYIPDGMEFSGYELFDDVNIAKLYYSFQNKIITFTISGSEENAAVNRSIDGEIVETFKADKDQISIELWKTENEVNAEKTIYAQWLYKNIYYLFSGNVEQDEIKKILESMAY